MEVGQVLRLPDTAENLVASGRGILAADESIATMSRRLDRAGVAPTAASRRDYRELLLTTPELSRWVSRIILCDETMRQSLIDGIPFPVAPSGSSRASKWTPAQRHCRSRAEE